MRGQGAPIRDYGRNRVETSIMTGKECTFATFISVDLSIQLNPDPMIAWGWIESGAKYFPLSVLLSP